MSIRSLVLGLAALLVIGGDCRAQDLRDRFNTPNLEATKAIEQAILLNQGKKHKEALKAVEAALKEDPQCQMAHYWHGIILSDLGDLDKAIEAYQKAFSYEVRRGPQMSAEAAFNLAMIHARLKEFDETCLWLTRAIVEDPANRYKVRGKAYRNLAITHANQHRNLAAGIAAAYAYEDKTPKTDFTMVDSFFRAAGNEEVARILYFGDQAPKLENRGPAKLSGPELQDKINEAIVEILPDPEGNYVVAWPKLGDHYYIIDTAKKLAVKKVGLSGPMNYPCLVEGQLYAVAGSPSTVQKIDVATGKSLRIFNIAGHKPTSLAVLPTQGRAFFGSGTMVHELNLKTGKVQKTILPGQVVMAHPNQQYLFSYLRPERQSGGGGFIVVNGRPVFFQGGSVNWQQTVLFKAKLVPGGLLLAESRENVASNAVRMSVSPDGQWLAVVGGGGFRPMNKEAGSGYGVAVFGTHNLEHLQGFFKTDPYPKGVSFNPVTNQVAVIREGQQAYIYHLTNNDQMFPVKGKFNGASAWSGNGRYLFLGSDGGLSVFSNELTDAEQKRAGEWFKKTAIARLEKPAAAPKTSFSFKAVSDFEKFTLATPSKQDLAKELTQILKSGRSDRPGPWAQYGPYQNDKVRAVIEEVREPLARNTDIGIAIYKLRKVINAEGAKVPPKYYLAEALRAGNQLEEAEKLFVEVIQGDSGRTNLSCLALNALGAMLSAKDRAMPALHCLLASLQLDRANPQTIALAVPLLKKQSFPQADRIAGLASGTGAVALGLPKLPAAPAVSKKMTAAEIYQKAVPSVVLIKTNTGSGSGVCVGRNDIVVTNKHVVGDQDTVEVFCFAFKGKNLVRLPVTNAQVIHRSDSDDIAVLKLEKAPRELAVLRVADVSPGPGEKIYALGSPGLGDSLLEQTITDGLVSSKNRQVEGATYLQHSAPVNPGNSGGPLLDEECRVVGIVTLNANLRNVSFAIPPEVLRKTFGGQ